MKGAAGADPGVEDNVFYCGVVIDNADPLKLERIRVRIPHLIEDDTMPIWLAPIKQSPFGQSASWGTFGVPTIGSVVFCIMQQEDIHNMLYMGSFLTKESRLPDAGVNYPYRYGFVDPKGNKFWVDMTEGGVTFHAEHKSGTKIEVLDSGAVNITAVGNVHQTTTGNVTFSGTGNFIVDMSGDVDVSGIGGNFISP